MGVEALACQGATTQEYWLSFKLLQRSQARCIGVQKCELILTPALSLENQATMRNPITNKSVANAGLNQRSGIFLLSRLPT